MGLFWDPLMGEARSLHDLESKVGEAYYINGHREYWGQDGEKNFKKAYTWIVKAAQQGHPRALAMVADMCLTGLGTSLNLRKGFAFAQEAASRQDVFGTYLLGKVYFWGWGTATDPVIGEKLFSQVLPRLEEAAEREDQLAQFGLGWIFFHLSDQPKDYQKAGVWYEKSAASGYPVAENNLGVLYGSGLGVRENHEKERWWYQKAAKQGYAKAQINLARSMEKVGNLSGQLRWTRAAAEQQYPHGLYRMGYLYEHGKGVKRHLGQALSWYVEAANLGYRLAEYQLGYLYLQGQVVPRDYIQALKWFTRSAEKGHAKSMAFVGYLYEKGLGIPADYSEARKWYLKGAEAGSSYSQEHIGNLLLNGLGGTVDFDQAEVWLRQASQGGREWSSYGIGLIYEYRGFYLDAIQWYLLSAIRGYDRGLKRATFLIVTYPFMALGIQPQSFNQS